MCVILATQKMDNMENISGKLDVFNKLNVCVVGNVLFLGREPKISYPGKVTFA